MKNIAIENKTIYKVLKSLAIHTSIENIEVFVKRGKSISSSVSSI